MKKILFALLFIVMAFSQSTPFDYEGWYNGAVYVPNTTYTGDIVVVDEGDLASESLNETDFSAHTKWTEAGDFAEDTGVDYDYTHSGGTGSLTQIQGNLAIAGVGDRWYKFAYTISAETNFAGAMTITTGFASSAVSLNVVDGTHTVYFKSKATPVDFVLSVTSTAGSFTIDDVTLKEINGGDITAFGDILGYGEATFTGKVTANEFRAIHATSTDVYALPAYFSETLSGTFGASTLAYGMTVYSKILGANLSATDAYEAAVTGLYGITGTNLSVYPKAGVLGWIADKTTTADGAFIALIDGDTGITQAGAAYGVRYLNSTPGSGFAYGLDLYGAAIRGYSAVSYRTADMRFGKGALFNNSTVDLLTITEANIELDGDVSGTGNIKGATLESNSGTTINEFSVDGTLAGDSDDAVPTEKAVKAYADAITAALHDPVTLNASATTGGMSLAAQEISNRAATNAQTGYMTPALVTNIETNNDKVVGTHPVATVYVPSSDQARLDDSAITIANTIVRVVGDGGTVLLDQAPSISDGAADGQMVIIQGTHDTNTVTIADNTNCQLAGGVNMTLGKGDTIQLIWDAGESDWYELTRSDN